MARMRNTSAVMLGNGAGGFGAPTWYPVAGHPAFISVADFNNDWTPGPTRTGRNRSSADTSRGRDPEQGPDPLRRRPGQPNRGTAHLPARNRAGLSGTSRAQAGPRMSLSRRTAAGVGMTRTSTTCSSGTATETSRQARCIRLPESEVAAPSSAISPETGETNTPTQPMSPGEEEAIVVLPGESSGNFSGLRSSRRRRSSHLTRLSWGAWAIWTDTGSRSGPPRHQAIG